MKEIVFFFCVIYESAFLKHTKTIEDLHEKQQVKLVNKMKNLCNNKDLLTKSA